MSANHQLQEAAFVGDRAECEAAQRRGATDFDGMLRGAAQGGHRDLCELAKDWGATNFEEMLFEAARNGHRDLCELAKSWGATNFEWMLYGAAYTGHRDLCELAKSWGATNFDWMLREAATDALIDLAKYWQACTNDPTLPAWVSLFGLLLLTDNYFRLSPQASPEHIRWFKITSQLPLELQAVICFRCHGLTQEPIVTRKSIDNGGRWLFPE